MNALFSIQEALGVSFKIGEDGSSQIHACKVKLQKKLLDFEKKVLNLSSVQELRKEFPKEKGIAINITGKGILYKQIPSTEEINALNFSLILPNANFQDFYVQNFIQGSISFVAVIRKAEADRILQLFSEQEFLPLIFSLGPFSVSHIADQLNIYSGDVLFDGYKVEIDREAKPPKWLSFQYMPEIKSAFPLKIEAENLDERLMIAYASAFGLLLSKTLTPIQVDSPAIQDALTKYHTDHKTKGFAVLYSISLFLLLFINFIIFSNLSSENIQLASQLNQSTLSASAYDNLAQEVKRKEKKLEQLGWEDGVNKASLIDQIASTLPHEIRWKEIILNPIDPNFDTYNKAIGSPAPELFEKKQIRIIGYSEKIIPVNEWISRLKTLSWVKEVLLENYTFNTEVNAGQFIIHVQY